MVSSTKARAMLTQQLFLALKPSELVATNLGKNWVDKKGEWNLNYLLTDKGQVIGTETSFSRKAHQADLPLPTNMAITKSKQPARLRKGKHRKNRR